MGRLRRGRSIRRRDGRVPDQGGGDDYSRLEDDGSLTICRLVPSVFRLMINRDILENLVIRNPLCIWTLLMLCNRIQLVDLRAISGFKWFLAQMFNLYSSKSTSPLLVM